MYHAIGTVITVFLLYLISFIFYRNGFYPLSLHRKLWNSVLAISFLFTALAGIFLSLQINYKWNIPHIDAILKWHVEIGVSLAITGIFHFLWHLSYFTRRTDVKPVPEEPLIRIIPDKTLLSINLFLVGFTSTSVQLLFMREILNISGGYELITGVYLGSWLTASAIGSYVAGRSSMNEIPKINLIFAVCPLISLFLLILLARLFLESGETPTLILSMVLSFLMLVPFCLVSAFTFIKLISLAKKTSGWVPGRSFSIETTGGIAAGITLSVLTSGMLNTFQILTVIIILSLAFTLLTFYISDRRKKIITKIIFIFITAGLLIAGPDIYLRQLLMPGIKVTGTKDTPYGNITTGVYGEEYSIYYNQRLFSYPGDAVEREENIHYALLQRDDPRDILLISGSLNSCIPELCKYNIENVTYVESDPGLIEKVAFHVDTLAFAVDIQIRDAFRYVRSRKRTFDAVVLLLPPPSTLSLNRFYTTEFFKYIKKNLSAGGIFMCSPGPGDYYINKESVNLYSSIYNSLEEVFSFIEPVAGNKMYFIASDSELSVSFCKLAEKRKIKNIYVSPDFMSDDLIQRKSEEIRSVINSNIRQNQSAFPIASFYFQSYHLSMDPSAKRTAITILIIVFALSFLTIRRDNIMMYASASSLAGFEILMLLALQLTIGSMYQLSGIIIAAIMAGLAAGSGIELSIRTSVPVKVLALLLVFYYSFTAICFNVLLSVTSVVPAILIIIAVAFPPSFITGYIFRRLTIVDKNGSLSASVYSADLTGSALGFIIISGVIIPVFGIIFSFFLLSGLIFAGIILGTDRDKY